MKRTSSLPLSPVVLTRPYCRENRYLQALRSTVALNSYPCFSALSGFFHQWRKYTLTNEQTSTDYTSWHYAWSTTQLAKSAEFKYGKEKFHLHFALGCTGWILWNQLNMIYPTNFKSLKEGHRKLKSSGRLFIRPIYVFATYRRDMSSCVIPRKNRAVPAVCIIAAVLVDSMNGQVSSLQRKDIAANLHWPF